ncbi:MAG: DUF6473 family protein [Pseudorhodobacter sp.]
MAFACEGALALDYSPCRYGESRLLFRGPKRDLEQPFVMVLGGTETYGKFVPDPFPVLAERKSGRCFVNMGCMNAGPDVFLKDPEVAAIAAQSDLAVVQILGATNLSNRFYSVHPRRNDRFLNASPWLNMAYREVDFTDFHFTRHMLGALQEVSQERFEVIAEELRATWLSRMTDLLAQLPCKTLLLWAASHRPEPRARMADLGRDPLLVDLEMVEALRPRANAYLEVTYSDRARAEGVENLHFMTPERPAAEGVPGTLAHHELAEALVTAVDRLL